MYYVIIKLHPYVNDRSNQREFVKKLQENQLVRPPMVLQKYSWKFQKLFEVVDRMVLRKEKSRIDCK